ncbi:regulatory protein, tetR family [Rhodococcus triatomae]|uniref:Regulatory protein, tetR family n=1 Tax=Rhodococcus triatomae TaxID=300028 RepID=A0A1G8FJJ4_9NOCA|nr:TetR family transcriptional regulator [Rhodococcus triatomae]SDH82333.1 regulatory protein, tetR family [Rhodococcus triatomae]
MRTAERLVAERGLRGASAREVVKASGHRNNSAVAYHFGSWEGLLAAVWELHAAPIAADRARRLAALPEHASLRELVAAYICPIVTEIGSHTPSCWARFNEQWIVGARLDFVTDPGLSAQPEERELRESLTHDLRALFARIADALVHLDPPDRPRRVALAARFVISALAAWERDNEIDGATTSLDALSDELVTLTVAVLEAH